METRFATKNQRRTLLILQDFRCACCGEYLKETFECDHIKPYSIGGKTTLDNLQALCKPCHQNKTKTQISKN